LTRSRVELNISFPANFWFGLDFCVWLFCGALNLRGRDRVYGLSVRVWLFEMAMSNRESRRTAGGDQLAGYFSVLHYRACGIQGWA